MTRPSLRKLNHPRVQIERIDALSAKDVEYDFDSHPTTTPNLQRQTAAHWATHGKKPLRFESPLCNSPEWVIHQRIFDTVEQHTSPFVGPSARPAPSYYTNYEVRVPDIGTGRTASGPGGRYGLPPAPA
jgi:hypothetical protein